MFSFLFKIGKIRGAGQADPKEIADKEVFIASHPLKYSRRNEGENPFIFTLIGDVNKEPKLKVHSSLYEDLQQHDQVNDLMDKCETIVIVLSKELCSIWCGKTQVENPEIKMNLKDLFIQLAALIPKTNSPKNLFLVNFSTDRKHIDAVTKKHGIPFPDVFDISDMSEDDDLYQTLLSVIINFTKW